MRQKKKTIKLNTDTEMYIKTKHFRTNINVSFKGNDFESFFNATDACTYIFIFVEFYLKFFRVEHFN